MDDIEQELERYRQELSDARQDFERAERAFREAERAFDAAARTYDGLGLIVQGLEALTAARKRPQNEELLPVVDSGQIVARTEVSGIGRVEGKVPRGKEAILRILSEVDRPWRVKDLVAEVERRGWIDPEAKQPSAAVSVAVRRLRDSGEVIQTGTGVYRLATKPPELPHGHPMRATAEVVEALRLEREGRED